MQMRGFFIFKNRRKNIMADNPFYKNVQAGFGAIDNMYRQPQSNTVVRQGTAAQMAQEEAARAAQLSNSSSGSTKKPSSSSSSSGSTAQVSGGSDLQSYLQGLYSQRQQAAQNAYNNSMGALQNAYGQQRNALESSFNTGRGVLDNSYNNSLSKIDNDAKKTLQESYVNRMLTQKNLGQQLAAQGISGGASESAMAGIANNYGNSRNSINETWSNNKADLSNTYQNSLAQLIQSYNSDLAQLESNYANQQSALNSNLENGIADGVGDYSSMLMSNPKLFAALSSTQNSMNSYNPIATAAINGTDAVNTQQVTDAGDATNYARYKAMLDQYVNAGLNKDAIVRSLGMAGADNSMIFKILSDNGM